jgi:hypothetical protein
LKEHQENRNKIDPPRLSEAVELFKREFEHDTTIKAHKANGGGTLESTAAELKKKRVKQQELRLPEPSQFKELLENIRERSGGWRPRDGDLMGFLA